MDQTRMNQVILLLCISIFVLSMVAYPAVDTTASPASPNPAKAYQNLSIDQCIQIALISNLDMRSAREQLKITESNYRITKSKTDIAGTISGEESRGKDNARTDSGSLSISKYLLSGGTVSLEDDVSHTPDGDSAYSSGATLKVSQPLLKGYGGSNTYYTAAGRMIYDEQMAISRQLQSNKRSLIYNVIASYYNLIGAQRSIQIAESAVDEAQRMLKAAQTKKEEGLVAKIDVIRAEVQLAQTQARAVSAKRNYESEGDSFVNLLGLELGTPISIDTSIQYVSRTVNLDSSLSLAYRNRVDYRSAELTVALDAINLKIAKRNLLPDVSFDASYGLSDSGSKLGDALSLSESDWSASLSWSVPLWQNRKSLKEDYLQSISQKIIDEISLEDARRGIALEVRQAIIGVLEAEESLQIIGKSVAAAEESLRLAKLSYEEALVAYLDVLDAQNNYTEVQNSYTTALIGQVRALANLDRVTASDPHL